MPKIAADLNRHGRILMHDGFQESLRRRSSLLLDPEQLMRTALAIGRSRLTLAHQESAKRGQLIVLLCIRLGGNSERLLQLLILQRESLAAGAALVRSCAFSRRC